VPPLPRELADQLEAIIPPHATRGNPLDLTGDTNAKMFQEVIQRARSYYDTLGVIFGDPILEASAVVSADRNELIIYLGGAEVERAEKLKMHHAGIPVFPTPERAIRAISQIMSPEMKAQKARHTFPVALGKSQMSLSQCFKFLEEKGFDCIVSRTADSTGKAAHVAHQLGFPVALKIDSPHILHKSDCGGVQLNLQSAGEVRTIYEQMMAGIHATHPEARLDGVVVSAMAAPGIELILGMSRDAQFGPLVMFGLGGITVELYKDVTLRLLPIDREEALAMIHEIKAAPLLKGYRGQQRIDENALVDALLKLAKIAEDHPDIVEIDLNPVFAYPEGLVVADARILKG
jgi:acetyltransferase